MAQEREEAGGLRQATSAVEEVAGELKRVTSVVEAAGRVPSVELTGEEASVLPASGARRAAPLPLAARGVSEGADQAAVLEVPVVEELPVVVVAAVDVGKHE